MKTYLKYTLFALAALLALSVVVCGGTVIPADAKGPPPTDTPVPTQPPGNYYVDCSAGTDGDGSSGSPWNNLTSVNNTPFGPGCTILFKRGTTCNGQLAPSGSGASGSPIVFDAYGTGDKPHIAGGGVSDAVYLYNMEYVEIRNLEVTNSTLPASNRRGIHISVEDIGTASYYRVLNNTIHDIAGDDTKDMNGSSALHFTVVGGNVQTKFSDVLIEGNTIYTVDRSGINMSSVFWCRDEVGCRAGKQWYPWDPFTIRNNLVYDTGGDGIVNQYASGSVIEYNVVHDCNVRSTGWNVGIWGWNADNMTFQYNEAYLCRRTQDGQGFDIDYGQVGTIHQYEYSHDNEGGFMLICGNVASGNRDGIVRYCISQNDLTRVFELSGPSPTNTQVYNNTIYVGPGLSPLIVHEHNWEGYPDSVYFWNNIFYNAGNGDYTFDDGSGVFFDYNLFYGYHPANEPDDPHKITGDPLLVNPGSGGTGIGTVDGYQLQAGSAAIGAGKIVASNGGQDYWGNPVPSDSAPDVGAHQYSSGGPTPTPGPTDTPAPPTETPVPQTMHVGDIAMSSQSLPGSRYKALATVTILDAGDQPVGTATVYGEFTGATSDSVSGDTAGDGTVTLESSTNKNGGTWTFCVTDVVKSGWIYDDNANVETCDQITAP